MRNKKCIEIKSLIEKETSGPKILKLLELWDGGFTYDYERLINFAHKHMKKVDWAYWECLRTGFSKMVLNGSY